MSGLLSSVLLAPVAVLALPIGSLFIECVLAFLPKQAALETGDAPSASFSILIPAHNEASQIQSTIADLLPQVPDPSQIVVIADNCTDDTADLARQQGVTVIERRNQQQRGKGYALDYGLEFLAQDPPEVVVMVDADCRVEPSTIYRIVALSSQTRQPVQSLYLMETPAQPSSKDSISALAFLVKNHVRPEGLLKLKVPCPLTGTGMAFPWASLQPISLASGNIVEDMQLGIDLAIMGYPPRFCPDARVMGVLPQQEQTASKQRTRWEHGHLQLILSQAPRLVKAALRQRSWKLFVMALDLSVPPLSLLAMVWLSMLFLTTLAGIIGLGWQAAILATIEGVLFLAATFLAWFKFGQEQVPLKTLLQIPLYILWKIPLYFKFVSKRQKEWVRTDRDTTVTSQVDTAQVGTSEAS
ncbi:MAG: glycosyltransferase family 2 protein [Microcoleaceae cyanobacterium]